MKKRLTTLLASLPGAACAHPGLHHINLDYVHVFILIVVTTILSLAISKIHA